MIPPVGAKNVAERTKFRWRLFISSKYGETMVVEALKILFIWGFFAFVVVFVDALRENIVLSILCTTFACLAASHTAQRINLFVSYLFLVNRFTFDYSQDPPLSRYSRLWYKGQLGVCLGHPDRKDVVFFGDEDKKAQIVPAKEVYLLPLNHKHP